MAVVEMALVAQAEEAMALVAVGVQMAVVEMALVAQVAEVKALVVLAEDQLAVAESAVEARALAAKAAAC